MCMCMCICICMCVGVFTYLVNCATTYKVLTLPCTVFFMLCNHPLFFSSRFAPRFPLLLYALGGWPLWTPSKGTSTSHLCLLFFFPSRRHWQMKDLRDKGGDWGWIFIPPASSLWACHGWLRPSAEGHRSVGLFLPYNYSLWVSSNFLGPVDLGWK